MDRRRLWWLAVGLAPAVAAVASAAIGLDAPLADDQVLWVTIAAMAASLGGVASVVVSQLALPSQKTREPAYDNGQHFQRIH